MSLFVVSPLALAVPEDARHFTTIQSALDKAGPGDLIEVVGGIYRERVAPICSGEPGRPITLRARTGDTVIIRGSEAYDGVWIPVGGVDDCFTTEVDGSFFLQKRGRMNPFHHGLSKWENPIRPTDVNLSLPLTRGQVFVDGEKLRQSTSSAEVDAVPGTWTVEADGRLRAHFPPDLLGRAPADRLVEFSVREHALAPFRRGLGYIEVRGLVFEHACNAHPVPQMGMVSTRTGHHWTFAGCTFRHAATIGLDVGSEWGIEDTPAGDDPEFRFAHNDQKTAYNAGHHLVINNQLVDNGLCGLIALRVWGVRIIGNVVERNNANGFRTWEIGGIKVHMFFDGLIEGNLVRDNDAYGIWLDNQYRGTRVTRNVIVGNYLAGIMFEMGLGPALVDHNIIAHTRHGDGIYAHDASGVTYAHNLIYANAHYGAFLTLATDRLASDRQPVRCSHNRVINNLVIGNQGGAISLPLPWERAQDNVSDGNVFMGGGAVMDESTGPIRPRFQLNTSHTKQPAAKVCAHVASVGADAPAVVDLGLELEAWRKASGQDRGSTVVKLYHEYLSARALHFTFSVEEPMLQARLQAIPTDQITHADTADFFGHSMPAEGEGMPGPFQALGPGQHRVMLWPVRARLDQSKAGRAVGSERTARMDFASVGL